MEIADLNLVTYVIQFKSGLYFSEFETEIKNWERPYSTEDIELAHIFDTVDEAQRARKKMLNGVRIIPVSKKVFFKASLKGKR